MSIILRIKLKKQKLTRGAEDEEEEGEDRISGLPDDVLHRILTLLVTKEAIRTRVLSKRWNSVWTSIPVLDFGQWSPRPSTIQEAIQRKASDKMLMNFIEFLITSRNHNSPIQKFSLYCNQNVDTYRLHTWLSYLVTHRIQHLNLVIRPDRFVFPCSLFTCNSLKVFRLEMSRMFNLPTTSTTPSFPSLKILSLKFVKFTCNLFSNCPVLEELYLLDCGWMNLTINISAPSLKLLHICDLTCDPPFPIDNCEIDIFAPNITTLRFSANLPKRFRFAANLPFLDHATIAARIKDTHEITMNRAIEFLQQFSRVQHLDLQCDTGQVLFRDDRLSPHFPTFHHLITLQLRWYPHTLLSTTLFNMLRTMPNLKQLYIPKGTCHFCDDNSSTLVSLPQCLLLHLRRIVIRKILGSTGELDMIKFLLKNARALEEMAVTVYNYLPTETVEMVSQQLKMFPIFSQKGCLQVTVD